VVRPSLPARPCDVNGSIPSGFLLAPYRALAEVLRYERCSLVQAAAIPVCLGQEDVIAKAKTGTGKTLAFVIPTIEKVHLPVVRPLAFGGLVRAFCPHFASALGLSTRIPVPWGRRVTL
jgi:hypothetical protein